MAWTGSGGDEKLCMPCADPHGGSHQARLIKKKEIASHWPRRCFVRRRHGRPESPGFHERIRKGRPPVHVFGLVWPLSLLNIFAIVFLLCNRPSVECLQYVLAVMSQSARCSCKYVVSYLLRRLPSSSVPLVCYMFPRKGPGPLLSPPTPRQRFLISIV